MEKNIEIVLKIMRRNIHIRNSFDIESYPI